jgi:hypothetical protein
VKHSEYVEIIKKTATDIAVKAILGALLKEVPFLFWGPLGPLTKVVITKVVTIAYQQGEMAVFFKYIDMRVDAQGSAFSAAAIRNFKAQQSGTEDEKKKAEADLIIAFKSFAKLSN